MSLRCPTISVSMEVRSSSRPTSSDSPLPLPIRLRKPPMRPELRGEPRGDGALPSRRTIRVGTTELGSALIPSPRFIDHTSRLSCSGSARPSISSELLAVETLSLRSTLGTQQSSALPAGSSTSQSVIWSYGIVRDCLPTSEHVHRSAAGCRSFTIRSPSCVVATCHDCASSRMLRNAAPATVLVTRQQGRTTPTHHVPRAGEAATVEAAEFASP
mmetsp:Transcript_44318/g.109740  ORF Transcript_44318/g.109740 Transcript_44318/m.109740 type:complete len:215 (-) Transcript_44318:344-988(-)